MLNDDWMENVAGVPKRLFSVGVGCKVFHVSGINRLDLALLGLALITLLAWTRCHLHIHSFCRFQMIHVDKPVFFNIL